MAVIHLRRLATVITAAITNRKCHLCKEHLGVLHCDNNEWICESCAQIMSELGNDYKL